MFLPTILSALETYFAFTHVLVLTGLYSIEHISVIQKTLYFTLDAFVVLCSYIMIRKNGLLVLIHLLIHTIAVIQLHYNFSITMNNVYEMAEQSYSGKPIFDVLFYIIMTIEDIATHIGNAYWLMY